MTRPADGAVAPLNQKVTITFKLTVPVENVLLVLHKTSSGDWELMNMDSKRSQIVMPLPVRWYVQQHEAETRKMGGAAWIYNLGENALQRVRADNWYGHTLITGNVGSGKTTLLRLLSCGAIHCGNVVLAVDPKNDQYWRDAMKARDFDATMKYQQLFNRIVGVYGFSSPFMAAMKGLLVDAGIFATATVASPYQEATSAQMFAVREFMRGF